MLHDAILIKNVDQTDGALEQAPFIMVPAGDGTQIVHLEWNDGVATIIKVEYK